MNEDHGKPGPPAVPLDHVIAEYLAAEQTGHPPSREELLSRYPAYADQLAEFLDNHEWGKGVMPPPKPADPFRPPHRLGRIDLVEVVGRGAFGTVYKGWDAAMLRLVAVKAIRRDAHPTAESRARAEREFRIAAQFTHHGIVRAYDVGAAGDVPYFVSEFVAGRTLARQLDEARRTGAARPHPDRVAELIAAIADAVDHAHQKGVVHRDIKPANIILRADGTPVLTDFGLAHWAAGDDTVTADGRIVGTLAYMSPEQARGQARVDRRSDVYSLGVMLYELLTGERPFVGTTPGMLHQIKHDDPRPLRGLDDGVPRDLETVCLRCLQKEPARRYATAAALADDLRRFLAGKPVFARPVGRVERAVRWGRRNPALAAAAGLAAALLVATAAVSAAWAVHAGRQADEVRKALHESNRVTAEGHLDRGLADAERGDVGAGLHWMARSLGAAPEQAAGFAWTVRANLTGWRRQHYPLTSCFAPPPGHVVGFDPSGARVWVASPDGCSIRCWDLTTERFDERVLTHAAPVTAFAVSRDGARVATGCAAGKRAVRLWDARTGKEEAALAATGEVRGLAFLADGDRLVAATLEPRPPSRESHTRVQVWDVASRQARDAGWSHPGFAEAVALDPDSATVFVADRLRKAVVSYELGTGRRLDWGLALPTAVRALAARPGGQTLATAGADGVTRLWHRATGRLEAVVRHREPATAVGFGAGDQALVTASPNDAVRVWGLPDSGPVEAVSLPTGKRIDTLALNPAGDLLASGSDDGQVRVWRTDAGLLTLKCEFPPQLNAIKSVRFSPDGRSVGANLHVRGGVRVWDVETGRELVGLDRPVPAHAWAFSPDGTRVAAGLDTEAVVWSITGNGATPLVLPHDRPVRAVAFCPAGRTVVTGCAAGVARRWDAATGVPGLSVPHDGTIRVVEFSPDGGLVLTAAARTTQLWRPGTGDAVGAALEHGGDIRVAAFGPGARCFVTGGGDHTAQVWDTATGRARGLPLRHADEVTTAAIDPAGQWAVTGSDDGTARLWGVEFGRPLGPPLVHAHGVKAAVIDRAGAWVLTAGVEGTIRRWPAPAPAGGSAAQFVAWAEVVTGTRLDVAGATRVLTPAEWHAARDRLQALGRPPGL